MDGGHQLHTFHTHSAWNAPASVDARRALPVGPRPLTGRLRKDESLTALLTAYRAERDSTVSLWHEAMLHLREHRYDQAVLGALELARRARGDSWEPLPDGIGLAPLREWLALWQVEAQRILGAVIAIPPSPCGEPPREPRHAPPHASSNERALASTGPANRPAAPLDPSRLVRRHARWRGEEEGVG